MKKLLFVLIALLLCAFCFTACNEEIPNDINPIVDSEGLEFISNGDGTCYVNGIGTCTDTYIVIPATSPDGDRVTSIGSWAFSNCPGLKSIIIPNSVTSIGNWAFSDCPGLTSIIIPNSVTSIGDSAFYYCPGLTSITIPNSVTSIAQKAFEHCSRLKSIIVDANNQNYKSIDGNLYSKDGTVLIRYATGKTDANFNIPDGVTSIGDYAFSNSYALKSVNFPEGMTSIGAYAFHYCHGFTSIEIPDSVTNIGSYAFRECDSLTSIKISASVTNIDSGVFESCDDLNNITVDANNQNYKSIDGNLYSKDGTILIRYAMGKIEDSFEIPEGVTSLGNDAFASSSNLVSITIPDSVTSLGENLFHGCRGLTSVTIGSGVTSISEWAFSYCESLTSITIPASVTNIGREVFEWCNSLTDVYYTGSEEDWAKIIIDGGNENLKNATITYNYGK